MVVHFQGVEPVRKKDGTWTAVIKEYDEDIPDLGRHSLWCNKCGDPHYPDCTKFCPDAKDYIEK